MAAGLSERSPCKAMLDRLTDRAHIIETGTESYRFRKTVRGALRARRGTPAVSEGRTSASAWGHREHHGAGLRSGRLHRRHGEQRMRTFVQSGAK